MSVSQKFGFTLRILPLLPPSAQTDASDLREPTSKTRRPPRPYVTVRLEALYHHLTLGLVLLEIPEESFLFGIVLAYPLQAALHEGSNPLTSRHLPSVL
jgi:hypothetical protein